MFAQMFFVGSNAGTKTYPNTAASVWSFHTGEGYLAKDQ